MMELEPITLTEQSTGWDRNMLTAGIHHLPSCWGPSVVPEHGHGEMDPLESRVDLGENQRMSREGTQRPYGTPALL